MRITIRNVPFGWQIIAKSDAGVYYAKDDQIGYARNDADYMETWPRTSTAWKRKLVIKGFKYVGRQNKGGGS